MRFEFYKTILTAGRGVNWMGDVIETKETKLEIRMTETSLK